jgi:hypothetical protein
VSKTQTSGKDGNYKIFNSVYGRKAKSRINGNKLDLKYINEFSKEYSSYYFTKEGNKEVTFSLKSYPLYMARYLL